MFNDTNTNFTPDQELALLIRVLEKYAFDSPDALPELVRTLRQPLSDDAVDLLDDPQVAEVFDSMEEALDALLAIRRLVESVGGLSDGVEAYDDDDAFEPEVYFGGDPTTPLPAVNETTDTDLVESFLAGYADGNLFDFGRVLGSDGDAGFVLVISDGFR